MNQSLSRQLLRFALWGVLLIGQCPAIGQVIAMARQQPKPAPEKTTSTTVRRLQDVLNELKTSYQADILFEDQTIAGLTVPSDILAGTTTVPSALDRLLRPFKLRYKQVKPSTWLILKRRETVKAAVADSNVQLQEKSNINDAASNPKVKTDNSVSVSASPVPVQSEQAQELTVRGRVTDTETNEGLPGVSVVIKGTNRGTTTDGSGRYQLDVPPGNLTLVFSFVGYVSRELPVPTAQTTLDLQLTPDNKSLSEVVVVGYGTQRKADVTGATATITAKDFNTGVINNPLQAVQGRVAGLNITNSNSDPTNNRPTIRLRGIGSLTANAEPLIVIDGVLGASLNAVAPEDIEKVDVLKDASASAIYGSRGANGVIIITTKRGKAGRMVVDYNAYVGFSSPYKLPRVLNPDQYFQRYNELNPTKPSTSPVRTDWFNAITRTAVSMNHNIGLSGGTETSNYRASIAYLQQPGIALNSGLDRINARLNVGQKAINNRLDVQINLSANLYKKNYADYTAFNRAAGFSPLEPIHNADGSLNNPNLAVNFQSPVTLLTVPTNQGNEKQLLGNVKLSFEIIDGLKAGINTSYSLFNGTYAYFTPKSYYNKTGQTNTNVSYGSRSTSEVNDRLVEYTLAYDRTIGAHTVGALVGYTYQYLTNETFGLNASDFPDQFAFNNLGAANQMLNRNNISSNKSESKLDGLLARVNYAYQDKYLLTANFRRDGSSRFGINNRYGYFPSVSVGWRLSQEPFLQNNSFVSDLKLRVGYGVTGNQNGIPDYASQLLFGANSNYARPTTDPLNPITYSTSYFFSQNANPNLKWETSAQTNIGLDFGLFKNRLTGAIEFYSKDTRNLLFTYSVSPGDKYANGLTYISNSFLANIGSMNNRGVELTLDYQAVTKENFTWRTSLNLAHNQNKVTQLTGDGLTFPEEGIRFGVINRSTNNYGPYAVLREGLAVGTFYAPQEVGVDDKGQPLYGRSAPDGTPLTPSTDPGQATRQILGSPQPKLTLGWSNALTYRNFDLSIFFRGSFGQKVLNASNLVYNNPTTFRAGDQNAINVYTTASSANNASLTVPGALSSRYIEDGSFLRLDNLNLSYRIPVKADWLRGLRAYVAGQNLLLITGYKGLDPEVRSGTTSDAYGSVNSADNLSFGLDDFFFYPRARTVTVGLSATF